MIVRTASSDSPVTRILSSDGSSLVLPMMKRITSNEALCRMTVSKIPFRIPESMRCPDASTTSDATVRSCPFVADHDERQVVVLRGRPGEAVHVGEQVADERLGGQAAMPFDRGQQAIVGVLVARFVQR